MKNHYISLIIQVRLRTADVNTTHSQVQEVVEDTSVSVSSNTHCSELQNRSQELIYQANSNNNRSLTYQNVKNLGLIG